uniref:Uncharacterized protein n=1 Tax=Ananas comosus var. bracteatus TaxID=296719 RepID=A0A6V7NSN7_ANACO|nr:unnamed protein product [Ananas comosus var. bracteatus]
MRESARLGGCCARPETRMPSHKPASPGAGWTVRLESRGRESGRRLRLQSVIGPMPGAKRWRVVCKEEFVWSISSSTSRRGAVRAYVRRRSFARRPGEGVFSSFSTPCRNWSRWLRWSLAERDFGPLEVCGLIQQGVPLLRDVLAAGD